MKVHSSLPVRHELLRSMNIEPTPHRVRARKRDARRDYNAGRELRAAWFLWLMRQGCMTIKAACAVMGMSYQTGWRIYIGQTHVHTMPVEPPKDVWAGR